MIRGSQTLTAIFNDDNDKKRQFNGAFTKDRDIAIAYRFYYHYNIMRRRFDDIPNIMEQEFFLGSSTILKKLAEQNDLLKNIKQAAPGREQLRQLYPHLNWN